MNSIAKALNNIAIAITNLGKILIPVKEETKTIIPTTVTSNPVSANVTITSIAPVKQKISSPYSQLHKEAPKFVSIPLSERNAVDAIYLALIEKGNHPEHHDRMMKELSTKWPTLHRALKQLVSARKENYNHKHTDPWKPKDKW